MSDNLQPPEGQKPPTKVITFDVLLKLLNQISESLDPATPVRIALTSPDGKRILLAAPLSIVGSCLEDRSDQPEGPPIELSLFLGTSLQALMANGNEAPLGGSPS